MKCPSQDRLSSDLDYTFIIQNPRNTEVFSGPSYSLPKPSTYSFNETTSFITDFKNLLDTKAGFSSLQTTVYFPFNILQSRAAGSKGSIPVACWGDMHRRGLAPCGNAETVTDQEGELIIEDQGVEALFVISVMWRVPIDMVELGTKC